MLRALSVVVALSLALAAHAAPRSTLEGPALDGLVAAVPALPTAAPRSVAFEWARRVIAQPAYLAHDPTLAQADDLVVTAFRFGARRVLQVTPVVDGVRVEGATRVLVVEDGRLARVHRGAPLVVHGTFALSPESAVLRATPLARGALVRDATVEDIGFLARRVLLAEPHGLRPAYRVRVPTFLLTDALDVWIDATDGHVLKSVRVARALDGGVDAGPDDAGLGDDAGALDAGPGPDDAGLVDAGGAVDAGGGEDAGPGEPAPPAPTFARYFQWHPDPAGASLADLEDGALVDLIDAELGSPLLGRYFETRNCCKEHVCLGGASTCQMNDPREARCATADDDDPITSTLAVEIPTDFLSLPIDFDVLYAKSVFCAELPRVRSRPAQGPNPEGWLEAPVDEPFETPILGPASEEDAFAEIEAYAATSTFFAHFRDVTDDPTFCLRAESMACDEDTGLPVVDDDGRPVHPFRVTVNTLIPGIDLEGVLLQLLGGTGKGQTPGNPLEINEYARQNQAVFLPALSGGPVNFPPELEVIAQIFTREFDSTIFFQGERDFSYDGAVVFHEFAHAIIHTLKPDLDQYGRDEMGAHAYPGALNEAYSDYFAASLTGDPVIGRYSAVSFTGGEVGQRVIENERACPRDVGGDSHDDSLVFSGALWEIRDAIVETEGADALTAYDRLLWQAIAEAGDAETFAENSARVLDLLEDEYGSTLRFTAAAIFAARAVDGCERVFPLSAVSTSGQTALQTKERLFMTTRAQLGLDNYSPGPVQFRVEVPKGTAGFRVRWEQASLIDQQFGGTPVQLSVLVVETDEPIVWTYEGANQDRATPSRADGTAVAFNPEPNQSRADMSAPETPFYNVVVDVDPCAKKVFHVALANIEGSTPLLSNIAVELIPGTDVPECTDADGGVGDGGDGDGDDDLDEPPACGCDATRGGDGDESGPLKGVVVALVALRLWRRRR